MMERPILHFPMVRIHHIAVEEAREAAKTVSTQTLETDPSASPNYYSKKSQQTWPSLRMTSLKPATHQQPRRRISMVSGSIRIPPEDNYSYGSTTYIQQYPCFQPKRGGKKRSAQILRQTDERHFSLMDYNSDEPRSQCSFHCHLQTQLIHSTSIQCER